MVKVMRTYTMDTETAELLKNSGTNASELINKLVQEYFKYGESDDPKALEKRKLEFEEEIDIYKKRLEHVKDRLIILRQKEQSQIQSAEFKEKLKEIKSEAEDLNQKWRDGYFDTGKYDEENDEYEGHKEYWEQIKKVQNKKEAEKPGFVNRLRQTQRVNG